MKASGSIKHLIKDKVHRLISMFGGDATANFPGSQSYWEQRYRKGGNSGTGSHKHLAEYKAGFLNKFVKENRIHTIIEFGCGDGNQLRLSNYPSYFGVDTSKSAVSMCQEIFNHDENKSFSERPPEGKKYDLSLSIDVIYHLTEDDLFDKYMRDVFHFSDKWIIIYSSDEDQSDFLKKYPGCIAPHVRHRQFSSWIKANAPDWARVHIERNPYPFSLSHMESTSFADFHIFRKQTG